MEKDPQVGIVYCHAGLFGAVETDWVLPEYSLERMLIETDAPYLAPVPFRGKRNEPSFVPRVAEKIAELHGVSVDQVARQTSENFISLFKPL